MFFIETQVSDTGPLGLLFYTKIWHNEALGFDLHNDIVRC